MRAQLASMSSTSVKKSLLSRLLRMKLSSAARRASSLCIAYAFRAFPVSLETNEWSARSLWSLDTVAGELANVNGGANECPFSAPLLIGLKGRGAEGLVATGVGYDRGDDEAGEKLWSSKMARFCPDFEWPLEEGRGVCGRC